MVLRYSIEKQKSSSSALRNSNRCLDIETHVNAGGVITLLYNKLDLKCDGT